MHTSTQYETVFFLFIMGTPISTHRLVQANPDGDVAYNYVFCELCCDPRINTGPLRLTAEADINKDNILKQRTIDNNTYTWSDGLINDLNITTLASDRVGLSVCWYYGPIMNSNMDFISGISGMRLWVATSAATFDQYAWRLGMSDWVYEQNWVDMNGQANPACHTPFLGNSTYVMFVNQTGAVDFYWLVKGCRP